MTLRETSGLWMNDGLMQILMQHFHAEFSCSDLKHNCITHTAATDQMAAHVPQAVQAMKDMVDFGHVVKLFQSGFISCSAYPVQFHPLPALAASTWAVNGSKLQMQCSI